MINKTHLIFLCFILTLSSIQAQTIIVSELDDYVAGESSTLLLTARATVSNSGSTDIDVLVEFNQVLGVQGAGHYFCWAVCYNEGQVSSGFQTPPNHFVTIPAGQSVANFYADYVPHNTIGAAIYEYCFYDKANPTDKTCVQITFDTQNVGIEDVFASDNSGISESYPNPATSTVNINYSLKQGWKNANIVVYSMLGSQVKNLGINQNAGTASMDVSSLPAGMYFYTLNVDGEAISTRKMLVTK